MLLLHLRIYTSPHIWLLLSFLVLLRKHFTEYYIVMFLLILMMGIKESMKYDIK